ncbi:hypothetical protein HID58_047667 [Brassica napus]|uniref:PH domain-containing protein n=1 Tax=Brassica napus TaxID=3708 RepID=A0ABQ8AZZ1_BRANA|nr:hypothetical protein HID58_047667 [Brassica napus]
MSSPLAAKSNPTTRSISLNTPHSARPNRHHDLRYSLSAGPRTNEDRPQSGNGVAGILYKWINYGQGWKRRWFVLQDGVLSYYRIHGPDKISLSVEMDRRSKLIGGESLRFICRHSKRADVHSPGKPLGQIHLKIWDPGITKLSLTFCGIEMWKDFSNSRVKLLAVKAVMIAHPKAEWFWWIDSDESFIVMEFMASLHYRYQNLVVYGWPCITYVIQSWIVVNADVFHIGNCQWSMEVIDTGKSMGPASLEYAKWGSIQKTTSKDKLFPKSDDLIVHFGGIYGDNIERGTLEWNVVNDDKKGDGDTSNVSSIGQGISDSKRFTVFTGTKSLHLRAASSEDRTAWIEALRAVKETFPRMSNEELMATTTNVSISTDKLRQRLMKEEVDETIIKDCEDIMKNNFIALHNEVMTLKQYQCHLVDTLKNVNSVPELE